MDMVNSIFCFKVRLADEKKQDPPELGSCQDQQGKVRVKYLCGGLLLPSKKSSLYVPLKWIATRILSLWIDRASPRAWYIPDP